MFKRVKQRMFLRSPVSEGFGAFKPQTWTLCKRAHPEESSLDIWNRTSSLSYEDHNVLINPKYHSSNMFV